MTTLYMSWKLQKKFPSREGSGNSPAKEKSFKGRGKSPTRLKKVCCASGFSATRGVGDKVFSRGKWFLLQENKKLLGGGVGKSNVWPI